MSFYSELADTANELIDEFGQAAVVTNYEGTVEDFSTGVVTPVTTTFNTVGVLLDYDYRNFGEASAPYTPVSNSDKRIILKADNVVNVGDTIYIDNTLYRAHVIKAVNPAGTRVLYDMWVKR
jgi:hypothetical protein